MRYKISELNNKLNIDTHIEGEISYKDKIKDDIENVSLIKVDGDFEYIKSKEGYLFNLDVKGDITILSAISLKPVKLLIDFNCDLFYTFKVADDDSFEIEKDIIDLDEQIWGEIILHLPPKVILEGEEFDESDNVEIEKDNPFKEFFEEE